MHQATVTPTRPRLQGGSSSLQIPVVTSTALPAPIQVLSSLLQKDLSSIRSRHTMADLIRTPAMRKISSGVSFVWQVF